MTLRAPLTPAAAAPSAVFDRRLHQMRRNRAAVSFDDYSFLKRRAAEDVADRIASVTRRFARVLDLGAHSGDVSSFLRNDPSLCERIDTIVASDFSPRFAPNSAARSQAFIAADEEWLPFKDHAFDLVVSALSLHWVNDLPGTLIQIRRALAPDGFFVGAMLGGATLTELRQSLLEAEADIRGGASQRVSPFADALDLSGLLQRAGFAMPVSDTDRVTVRYDTPLALLADLRGMGETAAPADKSAPPLTRAILMRAMEIYQARFSEPDGRIRATFELISASGWAPAPDQPKPKRPGSATVRLADALGVTETAAGEKTYPLPTRSRNPRA